MMFILVWFILAIVATAAAGPWGLGVVLGITGVYFLACFVAGALRALS